MYIISFNPYNNTGAINIAHILQMRKQKIKEFSQLHTTRKWQQKPISIRDYNV